tara:strand:+ start:1017 stop:1961 length:945 start_codon:yes stop_codon:yes gene_type:complete
MRLCGKKITSIERLPDTTIIDWVLGNYCNFQCSYCFPNANTGTCRVPRLDINLKRNIFHLLDQIDSTGKQKVSFHFGGGEPTLYRDIIPLMEFVYPLGYISFVSNGSRTVRWWKQNVQYINHVLFSYHSEYTDLNHMMNVIETIEDTVDINVHVMVNPKLFDKCVQAYKTLSSKFSNVDIQLKLLREDGRTITYTKEQYKIINENLSKPESKPSATVNCEGTKSSFKLHHIKDLSGNFTGYNCYAHHDFLQIDKRGNVGKMSCGQDFATRSNIYSKNFIDKFTLPKSHVVCQQEICGCVGLLFARKEINEVEVR